MEVTLSPEQETRLEDIASRTGRTSSELLSEALDAYLDHDRWYSEAIAESRAAVARGEFIDHDDVVRDIEAQLRG